MVLSFASRPPRFEANLPAALQSREGGFSRGLAESGFVRFLAVGCCGLATDAALFSISSRAGAVDAMSRALSLAVSTLVTWRLNRHLTFAASGRRTHDEAMRYVAVALCAQGFNYGLFLALRSMAPQLWPLAILVFSSGCAAGFSFLGQSLVTFSPVVEGATVERGR